MHAPKESIHIAAIADLHYGKTSQGMWQGMFAQISDAADILLICGDLTDHGLPEEAQWLVKDYAGAARIPAIAVLGNHDYESDKQDEIRKIVSEAGITVLDGESCEMHGLGFAGVKGFAGGFGRGTLGPWGERTIKLFVHEAVDEALKLETALANLRNLHRIALLHYAPIRATAEGELPEILPFLGCSRLEEPLTRYPVTAVFHGHAHTGTLEGRTSNDVPVYNVSMPLLRRSFPDRSFQLIEVSLAQKLEVVKG